MNKKSKLIIIIASIVLVLVTSVVLVCTLVLNKEEAPPIEPQKTVGLIDNGTKENLDLSFIADGETFKGQTIQKVYEFKFENELENDAVVTQNSIVALDNMEVSYYFSGAKLTEYQSLQGGEYSEQSLKSGASSYIYLIVRVQDTTKNASCKGTSGLSMIKMLEVTFVCEYMENVVVKVRENAVVEESGRPILPANVLGVQYSGWYTDSTCISKYDMSKGITDNITLYAKKAYAISDWFEWSSSLNGYAIVKGTGVLPSELIIPEMYNGVNGEADVVYIQSSSEAGSVFFEGAFYGRSDLVSVVLPTTITELSMYTFYCCYNLEVLVIPKTVVEISNNALQECGLKRIYLEDATSWYKKSNNEKIDSTILGDPENAAEFLSGYNSTIVFVDE